MILLDICINTALLILAFNVKNFFKEFTKQDKKTLNLLLFYHIVISVFFHFYILGNGGDAVHYWEVPHTWSFDKIWSLATTPSGTGVMYLINYIPSKVLGLSFFTGNMIYSFYGYLGFVFIFRYLNYTFNGLQNLREIKLFKVPLFPLIWFLPNFHFWTSGIGKDALLFTSIVFVIYSLTNFKKHLFLLGFSSLVIIAIRPHILLFLMVGFSIAFIFDGRLKGYQKGILFLMLLVALAAILPFVMNFVQLDSFETEAIEQYAQQKSSSLSKARTSSSIDTSSYPFPLKFFTFLYRPLFFDINGVLAILSSFENFILLIITVLTLLKKPFKFFKSLHFTLKGSFLFFFVSSLAFSLILGNLGIMLRQKNMLMPWLVIFCLFVFQSYNFNKSTNATINNYQ